MLDIDICSWEALPPPVQTRWLDTVANVKFPPLLTEAVAAGLSLDYFDPRQLADMAGRDPVLGAKLLAVANSARFGLTNPMTSIQRAVIHLGYNLVKTIMVAYQLETTFGTNAKIPKEHLSFVRRWSSCASVIAFQWGQAADYTDSSTSATAALLSRLGTLALGLGTPPPTVDYIKLPDELLRLDTEQFTWGVTTPTLGSLIATRWGLPAPLPELVQRQWEPLVHELPQSAASHGLSLICGAVVLSAHYLGNSEVNASEVLDMAPYAQLKANVAANHLLAHLGGLWHSARLQRELALANED
jgi:HD-like signal output (HDOD) protein